jgi:hypothetical protein
VRIDSKRRIQVIALAVQEAGWSSPREDRGDEAQDDVRFLVPDEGTLALTTRIDDGRAGT